MSTIPRFPADAPKDDISAALGEAGCAVVTGLADATIRQAVRDDLAVHLGAARVVEEDDPEEFYPGRTRRITGLVTRSDTVTNALMQHPVTRHACDRHLLPNSEFGYQVHVTAALEVGPGAREQVLHREEDSFTFFELPRPNIILASMWAISDFRADNGATLPAATSGPQIAHTPLRRFRLRRCPPGRCSSGWGACCTAPAPTPPQTGGTA